MKSGAGAFSCSFQPGLVQTWRSLEECALSRPLRDARGGAAERGGMEDRDRGSRFVRWRGVPLRKFSFFFLVLFWLGALKRAPRRTHGCALRRFLRSAPEPRRHSPSCCLFCSPSAGTVRELFGAQLGLEDPEVQDAESEHAGSRLLGGGAGGEALQEDEGVRECGRRQELSHA